MNIIGTFPDLKTGFDTIFKEINSLKLKDKNILITLFGRLGSTLNKELDKMGNSKSSSFFAEFSSVNEGFSLIKKELEYLMKNKKNTGSLFMFTAMLAETYNKILNE